MDQSIRFNRILLAIGSLAAATLIYETALVRFLAVAQFYHFAFLIVSLALLGFGASGTLLSLFPRIREQPLPDTLAWVGISFSISVCCTYGILNWLPFDSFSIAWDPRQILYFILYYLSLSLPFLVSGLGLGTALAVIEDRHHQAYAANLAGSGAGVLLAPVLLSLAGMLGVILCSASLGVICWLVLRQGRIRSLRVKLAVGAAALLAVTALAWLSILNSAGRSPLGIVISPYKGLAYARLVPGSEQIYGRWQASSRVDVVENAAIRRLPGLSYLYRQPLPSQLGLSVDGDALQPITLSSVAEFSPGSWLPEWWPFSIRPGSKALVLSPGAGFGLLQAAAGEAATIQTVLEDRLILDAVRSTSPQYSMFDHAGVDLQLGSQRSFLARSQESYDVVFLPLTDAFQPVTNGAYSISENYSLTRQSFAAAIRLLSPGGVFVSSRWLQNPPSEELRLVSTALAALNDLGIDNPQDAFVIYRGIQTFTLVIKPSGWESWELVDLRNFLERCRFDLVWAPDLRLDELNRWNQLQEPVYYQAVQDLFQAQDAEQFYHSYPFDIEPPTDDRPFFFHFFTWSQTSQILAGLGKTWQPFGGSGFLMLVFLLGLVLLLSAVLILLPLSLGSVRLQAGQQPGQGWVLLYFGLIGTGFMFLEIPLISQWRLFLNTPLAAFSVVVGVLLLFSGVGSLAADRVWDQAASWLPPLLAAALGFLIFTTLAKGTILSWPVWLRYLAPCLGLAPTGFLLGLFFPRGIAWVKVSFPGVVPWAWAVNGSASVVASVLTPLISLQAGYPLVLILGGGAYLAAWLILRGRALNAPR